MKIVKFAKRYRIALTGTSYQEWPAGAEDTVTNEVAARAEKAGVLDGAPVEAPVEKTPAKKD